MAYTNNFFKSAIRVERDRLLAEKASGQATGAQPVSGDAAEKLQKLEAERAELAKARDEALARAKSAEENAVRALNEARNFRLQNVSLKLSRLHFGVLIAPVQ